MTQLSDIIECSVRHILNAASNNERFRLAQLGRGVKRSIKSAWKKGLVKIDDAQSEELIRVLYSEDTELPAIGMISLDTDGKAMVLGFLEERAAAVKRWNLGDRGTDTIKTLIEAEYIGFYVMSSGRNGGMNTNGAFSAPPHAAS